MRKIINKILVGCVATCSLSVSMSSCEDYLDVDKYFQDLLTLDSAFAKRTYAEGFMANAFDHIRYEMADISGGGGQTGWINFASDDLLRCDNDLRVKKYQNAEYSAADQLNDDHWRRVYEPIRKATVVLANIDNTKDLLMTEKTDIKGQAHFLRGYAYWHLMQRFGPIPLAPDEGFDLNASYEELSVPRATLDETVERIEQEFLKAALYLNTGRASNQIGKPQPGAALAARGRMLLYYASPLFNGNQDLFSLKNLDGTQLVPQEYDVTKWARAAAALKEALEWCDAADYRLHYVLTETTKPITPHLDITKLSPNHPNYEKLKEYATTNFPNGWANIDPYESYAQVFNGELLPSQNPEIIFTIPSERDGIATMVQHSLPSELGGWNCIAVTQKQVDAYAMNDGRSISEAAGTNYYEKPQDVEFDKGNVNDYRQIGFTSGQGAYPYVGSGVSLEYVNREPRFYVSVAFNGTVWSALSSGDESYQNLPVYYWYGSVNGKRVNNLSNIMRTGIGLKKYVHEDDSQKSGGVIKSKYPPSIRYADLLLMYAEALNELPEGQTYTYKGYKDQDVTVSRHSDTLRNLLKPIRMRAGVPDFTDAEYEDAAALRTLIKKERQIELFAEQKRYFDLRRWKDATTEEVGPIFGCNIDMTGDNDGQKQAFHTRTVVTSIPKVFETKQYLWPIPQYELKRNIRLVQNPGWSN